ncbi:hypothetical protein CEE37_01890 [candidate division LCP-89 bacterium B3_LCP]|uniref:Secretion system C-terminal sorting domain-containing protein n=1 Tax=candidate division LCP-89 bacterium B3_LCP TaxID=2012998 RepID=A0A532V5J7_UNCL8|nr:MAG: hypothetical protein CEE37_01890 [candidate division LCP-89 bacterium B3_LCP]
MNRLMLSIYILLFGFISAVRADTTFVASGPVSGAWTSAGNPYFVYEGDIVVPDGRSLTVLPGVEVLFTGNYKLTVEGLLNAEGTEADSITFTRAYSTEESKWRGFRFDAADDGCTLKYCRIEYAKGTGPYPDVRGGGVWIENCSVLIRNCTIAHNYTHNENYNGSGGGIFLNQSDQSIIEYNYITQNQADNGGGICVGQNCYTIIRHNTFDNNQTYSSGGGIYVSANGESVINDNIFVDNHSSGIYGGGAINLWSATWIYGTFSYVYNNLIMNNTASSAGGGIYHRYESSIVYNNTLVGNQANQGGGIYVLTFSDLPPTIYNSIIWGNNAPVGSQIYLDPQSGSVANISYCDVHAGWPGVGNINSDPEFVSGSGGDYYLSQIAAGQPVQSPCVDASDPISTMITGTTRTDGVQDEGIVDMGYHYAIETVVSMNVVLTPLNPPIQIPAIGGTFEFDVLIENLESSPVLCDIWTEAILPSGQPYPLILREDVNIPAGGSIERTLSQNVPESAPAGSYSYHAYVGDHPNMVYAEDSFTFEKLTGLEATRIYMDGDFSDWESVEPLHIDPVGDQLADSLDFGTLWVTNDERYLFLCLEVGAEMMIQVEHDFDLYLDTDNDISTGLSINGIGADLDYNFNDGTGNFLAGGTTYTIYHEDLGLATAPTYSSNIYEIVIDREAYPAGQYELFTSDTISVLFHDSGPGQDYLPDEGTTIQYVFDDSPLPTLPVLSLQKQDPSHIRIMSYNVWTDNLFEPDLEDEYTRILNAIEPDIIAFQEIYNHNASQTVDQVTSMLGGQWYGYKINPDIVLVSRYEIAETFNVNNDGNGAFLLDLQPDYDCQMLVINAHLPAGQSNTGRQHEVDAIMEFIREAREPGGELELEVNTPILITGDMNFVGYYQQLFTMVTGQIYYTGTYGPPFEPDWDGTNLTDLIPRHTDTPFYFTWYNESSYYCPGRLDFMIYSDSVLEAWNNFVLFTPGMSPDSLAANGLQWDDVVNASDHLPVVGDFVPNPGTVLAGNYNSQQPARFALLQNYPNPFNASTTISFQLPVSSLVELDVFDISGSRVGVACPFGGLAPTRQYSPGTHQITFDASGLASGIYLYRLQAGEFSAIGKMVLVK